MKRFCRICGKEFKPCRPWRIGDGDRWQDVACCEEHGAMYFAKVLAAKNKDDVVEVKVAEEAIDEPATEEVIEENEIEFEEITEEV